MLRSSARLRRSGRGRRLAAQALRRGNAAVIAGLIGEPAWQSVDEGSQGSGMARRNQARLARPLALQQRLAEGLEQGAIHRIVLRIVLGVPLHAEREAGALG